MTNFGLYSGFSKLVLTFDCWPAGWSCSRFCHFEPDERSTS